MNLLSGLTFLRADICGSWNADNHLFKKLNWTKVRLHESSWSPLCGSDLSAEEDESCCALCNSERPSKHRLFLSFHLFKVLLPCCYEKITFRGFESSACDFQCSSRGTVCTQFDSSNKHYSSLSRLHWRVCIQLGILFYIRARFKEM